MISYFEQNSIKKFLWDFFSSNFGQNRNDTKNKNRLFGRHFEMVQHFTNSLKNYDFYSVYKYGTNVVAKFRWKSVFFLRLGP